jgi:glycosyltransferase involved in cell wall biosynthesis
LCIRSPFFAGKEIITIYNGVNPDFYYPIKNTKREKGKILCVSSQWTKDKGIDFLIELAKRLDDYAFTVVGVMPNIKDMPNNIFAIGIVNSKNKLNELFNSHELFLNVSKQETFSLTNIEAQMSGTPVICFAQTGMKETIEPINSISIENYSSEEFIKAISSVRNKSLNHSQIRNFALQFNLGNMVSKYYELYLQHCTDSKIAE